MRTIAIINQKGGCGKTTTAINLTGMLARRGCRSLLVDLDPQSHCAAGLAIPEDRLDADIGDAMLRVGTAEFDPARLLWRVARRFDLVPSRTSLAGLEASRGGLADASDCEQRLRLVIRAIEAFQRQQLAQMADEPVSGPGYDAVCVDCPPSIGLLTYNALVAASEIVVPVETSFFSLQGATKQVKAIKALGRRLGISPTVRLVATMHDPSSALSMDVLNELHARFGDAVLPFPIRFDPKLRESASFGRPIGEYAPTSDGAQDYDRLAGWLMEHEGVRASELAVDDWEVGDQPAVTPIDELNARAREAGGLPPRTTPMAPANPTGSLDTIEREYRTETVTVVRGTIEQTGLGLGTQGSSHGPSLSRGQTPPPWARPEPAPTTPAADDRIGRSARDGRDDQAQSEVTRPIGTEDQGWPAPTPSPALAPSTAPSTAPEPVGALSSTSRAQDVIRRAQLMQRRQFTEDASSAETRRVVEVGANGLELVESEHTPVSAPPALRRLFGVTPLARGLTFVQPASIGREVSVAGSFNNWSPTAHRLKLNPTLGVFELAILVDPGEHEYRLVVDGHWGMDPFNPSRRPNEFGDINSVVFCPGPRSG